MLASLPANDEENIKPNEMKTILPTLLALLVLTSCIDRNTAHYPKEEFQQQMANYLSEPVRPLKAVVSSADKVALGKQIFYDNRLLGKADQACISCHSFHQNGTDPLPIPIIRKGRKWDFSSPTIIDEAHQLHQLMPKDVARLTSLADGTIQEEGTPQVISLAAMVRQLQQMPEYDAQFKTVYNQEVTATTLRNALVAYQVSIASPARFDDFMLGNQDAISMEEKMGYQKFKEIGCTTCHQGVNVGGNMFQKFGVVEDYFNPANNLKPTDYGLYNLTGNKKDLFVFRVPSLRNVALTPPYLHDGSIDELNTVIQLMGKHQLGKIINQKDITLIKAFLHSLTSKSYSSYHQTATIHRQRKDVGG